MNIQIQNLTKRYEQQVVLDKVNMEIQEGRKTCLMGKSGVGKTTLLLILMGLEQPDDGTISGIEEKKISVVFQENRLLEYLDAVKNIQFVYPRKPAEIIQVLAEVGIDESMLQKPISEYSGGMKRRVAIVRALLSEFDILLMDEPLQGLDEETKTQVVQTIQKYTADKTVIMVTHDIAECQMFQANLIVMEERPEGEA